MRDVISLYIKDVSVVASFSFLVGGGVVRIIFQNFLGLCLSSKLRDFFLVSYFPFELFKASGIRNSWYPGHIKENIFNQFLIRARSSFSLLSLERVCWLDIEVAWRKCRKISNSGGSGICRIMYRSVCLTLVPKFTFYAIHL